jgi:hypothetical protein
MPFPLSRIRSRFPSLNLSHAGRQRVYFDNPAGTQIAKQSLQRMNDCRLSEGMDPGFLKIMPPRFPLRVTCSVCCSPPEVV